MNIVTNGDFETGDFSGWSLSGDTNNAFVGNSPYPTHTGDFAAQLATNGNLGFLSQDLTTTTGALYDVSFWLNSDGVTPNDLQLYLGGFLAYDQPDIPNTSGWVEFAGQFQAFGPTTTLSIGFRDDTSHLGLDDVSVTLNSIPEPSVLTLAGVAAIIGAGFAWRRRRVAV